MGEVEIIRSARISLVKVGELSVVIAELIRRSPVTKSPGVLCETRGISDRGLKSSGYGQAIGTQIAQVVGPSKGLLVW